MAVRTARKPPKKPLSKGQFATKGGPLTRLYLPWPGVDVPKGDQLPDVVPFPGDGLYRRVYNPEQGTSIYVWEAEDG